MPSSYLWNRREMIVSILGAGLTPLASKCLANSPDVRVVEFASKENGGNGDPRPVVSCVAIEPASGLVASGGDDHLVRVAKLQDGSQVYRMAGHADWVRAAAFQPKDPKDPKSKVLATAGDDRRIILWDMTNGKQTDVLQQTSVIRSLAYSSNGQLLACAGFDGRVRVYRGTQLQWDFEGPGTGLYTVAFSPDNNLLAAAGRTGKIRIWDTSSGAGQGQAVRELDGGRWVRALAFAEDNSVLASGGAGRTIRLWDASSGKLVLESQAKPAEIRSLVFCGPALLASGRTDCRIQVWDAATLQERAQFDKHTGTVATLAWDANNGMLVSGSYDTTIRMFYLGAGTAGASAARPSLSPALR